METPDTLGEVLVASGFPALLQIGQRAASCDPSPCRET